MDYLPQLLTIAGVLLLACISPGPDFVAVTSHALSSRRSGVRIALGIAAAITAWAAITVCGLVLILARIAWLYEIIRLLGAAYLVYLGVQMLWAARQPHGGAARLTAGTPHNAFRRGFLIGITNPKSAAFFSSLFAATLPATAPVWIYASVVAIAGVVSVAWFSALALMFSLGHIQRGYQAARRGIDAVMGGVLTLLGLRLALSR